VLIEECERNDPTPSPVRNGPAWMNDPDFAQWVRPCHDTPEESRKLLLEMVKVMLERG
jgi:hypothetical protein